MQHRGKPSRDFYGENQVVEKTMLSGPWRTDANHENWTENQTSITQASEIKSEKGLASACLAAKHTRKNRLAQIQKIHFFIEIKHNYNRSTEVTVLSSFFDYWNKKLVHYTLSLTYEIRNEIEKWQGASSI
jgi:hypothetical protein